MSLKEDQPEKETVNEQIYKKEEDEEDDDEESESSEENDIEYMLKTGNDKEEDLVEEAQKDFNTLNILNESLRVKCNLLYKEMAEEGVLSNEAENIDEFSPFDDEYISYITENKDLSKRQKEAIDLLKKYKERRKVEKNGHDHSHGHGH